MSPPHAVFRADASAEIGTGHVVRSRTLAEALIALGWTATLATHDLPDALAASIRETGIRLLPLPATGDEGAAILVRDALPATLVVGDHYGLRREWFDALRPGATLLMAIDDLADRALPVDLVLNQNLGTREADYDEFVAPGTRVLAGPRHALLRPEFAARREIARPRDGRIERILVFMSGADVHDLTTRAVGGLLDIDVPIDVVVGAAYPHLGALRGVAARHPDARLHVAIDTMAELMDRADLAIGAASSASWERCALGLPAVLVTLADNQVAAERHLVESGAATTLGWHESVSPAMIGDAVRALMADQQRVAAMSGAAATITDGRGTKRVVEEIERMVAARQEVP